MNSINHLLKGVDLNDPNWIFQLARNIKTDSEAVDVINRLINSYPYVINKAEDFNEDDPEEKKAMMVAFNNMKLLISDICVILGSESIRRPETDPVEEENALLGMIRYMSGCED